MSPIRGFSRLPPREQQNSSVLAESRLNNGMITAIDPTDLQNGALTLAKEARIRYDKTSRRPGRVSNLPAAPNANKVLSLSLFKKNDATTHFLRFTRNSIHKRGVSSWIAFIAGTGGALTGTDSDRFHSAVVFDRLFFANGVNKLQHVDVTLSQFVQAGANSPVVKFVTGFYNRVVGAYKVGAAEGSVTLIWSADRDHTKWPDDPSPDISSGQTPVIESPSDLADFITGVFGGPSVLVLLRNNSIWLGSKLPVASNPFNLYTAVPGIGSDCPNGSTLIHGGIAFADTLSGTVWAYSPGSPVERIGEKIENEFVKALDDPDQVIARYDRKAFELHVMIPLAGTNVIRDWIYNFRTKGWAFDEIVNLSEMMQSSSPFSQSTTIDELAGAMDSLTGTFDTLGVTVSGKPATYFGYSDGAILEEDANATTDAGAAFTTDLWSKEFTAPKVETYFAEIRVEYIMRQAGLLTLLYTKDGGLTWKTAKTFTPTQLNKAMLISYKRQVKARRLRWRLTVLGGEIDVLGYEVHVYTSGTAKQ